MAIVQLDKLTLYGVSHDKDVALDGLQRLGCLHLISLREDTESPPEFISKEARETLRYLQTCPIQRRKTATRTHYDCDGLIRNVLQIKEEREQLTEEADELRRAIEDLEPWGDFQVPRETLSNGLTFWFYIIPVGRLRDLPDGLTWQIVRRKSNFAYLVALANQEPESMPVPPVQLDPRSLVELRHRLEEVEEQLEELHWQRVTETRWSQLLKDDLDLADDKASRHAAAQGALDDEMVFVVQGWVPRSASEDVRQFALERGWAVTFEAPQEDDIPPTLLKNPDRVAGAEGCVQFYITPAYRAWDPTSIVFFSFSIFFAMIVSDAGYGLIMAGGILFLWRQLGRSSGGRRTRNLLTGIVSATVLYGVLVGSYFGVEPPAGSLLDRCRIRIEGQPMMSNQTAMMLISVGIGVFHLVLANLISAWQNKDSTRCLGHIGWVLIMLGSFLVGMGTLGENAALTDAGKLAIPAGAIGVLLFSSNRPWRTSRISEHLKRLLDGVMQFANISKAFGDSLSYLRLFALGLASAQLAVTFNDLAAGAYDAGGVGVLLALIILLIGHGINFLLGLMSGVVHGLRLNCIEFFNWSLTEEGYSFRPFRKKAET